ncbi:assimilatory sulfite reductase (NADPH) flavoprotein subunit [Novosphingobium album (ex Liu et al. 2023)]|uniref:Sulfite reductase [NADPH] flavoprotein alpha-component n=1 Tax=Novosphingobium album (ex Liu et al. 2023) TaxID=3031130 RepID=A0ABT5WWK3_9SPHN|nr:assimilatory sulfite reductase (NADPH) flavoprotein subunit [Novosphingobium album (ex Liu et al. 2023)]MDE8654251.1 assimilatory sulfite reductase (NADPH) flavoprotein subunit [Novosphingobium album (ex Liu et al. 2023)]
MIAPELPGNPLTLDQWRQVEGLTRSLDPMQVRWLSGYFAGLDAGLRQPQSQPASLVAARRLTILYGTETGNAAELARTLATALADKGLTATLYDMADYKVRQLGQEQDVLIIVSTYGEGDPPQPATGFFEFTESRKAPKLAGTRFAVLALGDSTYEYYCQAGKRLDQRLEELGGQRLADRVDCDVDYEDPAAAWTAAISDQLASEAPAVRPSGTVQHAALAAPQSAYDKRNPFPAPIIENIAIVGRGSSKETRHIEFSLAGSGLVYEPGDALGIAASNDPTVVSDLLSALDLAPEATFELKGQTSTIGEALAHRFEITAATPRFLDYWALLSEAALLRQLQEEDRAGERSVFLRTHHIVDIVRRFPVQNVMPQGFISALRPLQPRLYSLASSLSATPGEAHLTVAPVRYSLHGAPRSGVASGLLADRAEIDTVLPVYVQSNQHFRLPATDAPILMIGAGTGIAPYRAFLQEREARGISARSWLFFGERNFRTDFLYQTEWQSWLKDGTLTRMDVAFSRDRADKIYVQHRMKEQARDIFAWLEEGAHVYVCGDAANLAPDVHEALIDIVAHEARTGREAAEDYVRSLQADHRYQRDVY